MRLLGLLVILPFCLTAACTAPKQPLGVTAAKVDHAEFEDIWQASLDTLREYSYTPDRQDRRAGLITSQRETGKQFWEFWRKDVPFGYELTDSSLHTMQREVRLSVLSVTDQQFDIGVEVRKYRWNLPERQSTSAATAAAAFSNRVPTSDGEVLSETQAQREVVWKPMGRDPVLEQQMLQSIIDHLPKDVRWQLLPASTKLGGGRAAVSQPVTQPASRPVYTLPVTTLPADQDAGTDAP